MSALASSQRRSSAICRSVSAVGSSANDTRNAHRIAPVLMRGIVSESVS